MSAANRSARLPKGLAFQDLLLTLEQYWMRRGCILQQPYDVEVGAGTMHPETFLRVLGPDSYRVVYAQPSRRPADGRYGENPNRLYKHTQFQVILKPSPPNIQNLYLESLAAVGIDLKEHDIRFEEDNWESPTLGAWGIGWQVLLDGLDEAFGPLGRFARVALPGLPASAEAVNVSAAAHAGPRAERDSAHDVLPRADAAVEHDLDLRPDRIDDPGERRDR